jgi:hypothetical protein
MHAIFDPCILSSGSIVLSLPDDKAIVRVAANIEGGQTTESVVVPIQRVSSVASGQ